MKRKLQILPSRWLLSMSMVLLLSCLPLAAQQQWGNWTTWGDTRDGYYQNPVMPADFSDIDCIRHDGVYYMISSTFQYQPGMIIMKSTDMVNWSPAGYAVKDIRQISPAMNYDVMDRYGRGIWAGAIRWHRGRFYVYFGTPDEGYFMTSSEKIEGPWDDLTKMSIGEGWDDCCPYIDEYGNGYLVGTCYKEDYSTYVFSLTRDFKDVVLDSRRFIHKGWGREANKLYRRDGWFYHLYSEVNNEGRHLMIQRSRVPSGPYEGARSMSEVQANFHEPNQGGFLYDDDGNYFFLTHHGSGDWSGRIASLLPVTFKDGWPIIGQPNARDVGEMVWRHKKPVIKTATEIVAGRSERKSQFWKKKAEPSHIIAPFGKSWEWNYYPRTDMESVSYRGGHLRVRLKAFSSLDNDNLLKVGNILSTRSWRTTNSRITIKLTLGKMRDGQRAGICHYSNDWSMFGVEQKEGERRMFCQTNRSQKEPLKVLKGHGAKVIYLRSEWTLDGISHYSYSFDGIRFQPVPQADYRLQWGYYRGDRLGMFTYNNVAEEGEVTFELLENRQGD